MQGYFLFIKTEKLKLYFVLCWGRLSHPIAHKPWEQTDPTPLHPPTHTSLSASPKFKDQPSSMWNWFSSSAVAVQAHTHTVTHPQLHTHTHIQTDEIGSSGRTLSPRPPAPSLSMWLFITLIGLHVSKPNVWAAFVIFPKHSCDECALLKLFWKNSHRGRVTGGERKGFFFFL